MGSARARGLGLALALAFAAPRARADDAACIAASEAEATLQKQAHFHDALKQAALCGDPSCPADVRTECGQRIAKMNEEMPTVVFGVADEHGNDLADVHVTLDGAPLVSKLDGRAIALDPGSHQVRFEAPGKPPLDKTIVVREGEKDRRINVVVGTIEESPKPAPSSWSTRKSLAIASGGVGALSIIVGSVLGGVAASDWSSAKSACNATSCPASTRGAAESSHDGAVATGDASTALFVVGALGLAGGVVLWLTAPRAEASSTVAWHVTPIAGAHEAGMAVLGRFP